jgi:hypothetical protein
VKEQAIFQAVVDAYWMRRGYEASQDFVSAGDSEIPPYYRSTSNPEGVYVLRAEQADAGRKRCTPKIFWFRQRTDYRAKDLNIEGANDYAEHGQPHHHNSWHAISQSPGSHRGAL